MTAFAIGQMQIHCRDWMEAHFAEVPDVVAAHAGRFVVRSGDPERIEVVEVLPDAAFVIEFPDRDHARAVWQSDAFQELAVLRRSGSSLDAIRVDAPG